MSKTRIPSKLERILAAGHLAVTSECGPPRGSDAGVIMNKANLIKGHVDAINVTDNQTAVTRLCSLTSVIHLKSIGLEPVLQMVVRDRNRTALQSDMLGAASFDIHSILCLSGDYQQFGDCPDAQVETIQRLKEVEGVRGFHIMAAEWGERVPEIVQRSELYPRPN